MSLCSTESNKGFYFAYFWGIFICAQIVGNLAGTFLVEQSIGIDFFVILSAIDIIFVIPFIFLPTPTKLSSSKQVQLQA